MKFKDLNEQLKRILNESPMYQNPRLEFAEFLEYVINNPNALKTYYIWNSELKIPSDTILHVKNRHNLSLEQWNFFLEHWKAHNMSKPGGLVRYNGKPIKYMFTIDKRTFGYVLEHFSGKEPLLTTVFEDHINNVTIWMEQEK